MVSTLSNIEKELLNSADPNLRMDGRRFSDLRRIRLDSPSENTFIASCGRTKCIATAIRTIVKPYKDKPNEGLISFTSNFNIKHSLSYNQRLLKETEMNSFFDNIYKKNSLIDVESLCLSPNNLVWSIKIKIDVLCDDGNIEDTANHAVLPLLRTLKVPKVSVKNGKLHKIFPFDEKPPLDVKLHFSPISVKVQFLKDSLVFYLDPTSKEESLADVSMRLAFDANGLLCFMQKKGIWNVSRKIFNESIKLARERALVILKKIENK